MVAASVSITSTGMEKSANVLYAQTLFILEPASAYLLLTGTKIGWLVSAKLDTFKTEMLALHVVLSPMKMTH